MKHPISPGPPIPPHIVPLGVGLALLALGAVAWLTRPAAPPHIYAPPAAAAPPQVWLLTTPPAGPVEPAVPLRVQVTLPSDVTPLGGAQPSPNVLLELGDAA